MSSVNREFRPAMDPPDGPLVLISRGIVGSAIEVSRASPRRRVILPFHKSGTDALQRMLNVLQPFSYIRPHRHLNPPKAESIVALQGSICYVGFDDKGNVTDSVVVGEESGVFGIDSAPGVMHTFFALQEDTVLFEVKPGPYEQQSDKDFAGWAPEEWTHEAAVYLKELYQTCCPGRSVPGEEG
jgi:cupin fold WbuC family metalloprotein